jgi:hypothetical protein
LEKKNDQSACLSAHHRLETQSRDLWRWHAAVRAQSLDPPTMAQGALCQLQEVQVVRLTLQAKLQRIHIRVRAKHAQSIAILWQLQRSLTCTRQLGTGSCAAAGTETIITQLAPYPVMTAIPRAERIGYSESTTIAWMLPNAQVQLQASQRKAAGAARANPKIVCQLQRMLGRASPGWWRHLLIRDTARHLRAVPDRADPARP